MAKACCGCNSAPARDRSELRTLPIVWQRLVTNGTTCPRCAATQVAVEEAVQQLSEALAPLGVRAQLDSRVVDLETFEASPGESNRIWIAGRPIEDWLGAESHTSPCCDVCGEHECRTIEVAGVEHESIPASLILKAGLIAAAAAL